MSKTQIVLIGFMLLLIPGCAKSKKPTAYEVQITVTEKGFEPARTTVPRGEPIMLVVERKTDKTCATEIVLDGVIRKKLPLNKPIQINLPADVVGDSLGFACGMDMYTGVIVAK